MMAGSGSGNIWEPCI